MKWLLILALALGSACGQAEYKWAFAQSLDGTFNENELCRESLATSIYAPQNKNQTEQQATSNIFLFRGAAESYRIYGFKSQQECETALTNMKLRQKM